MSDLPARPLPSVHQRPWAVGVYLALASLVGLAWSAPVASTVAAVTGAYPRGDAEVFDPGGLLLLEAARRALPSAGAIRASWILTAILGSFFGFVALAFAIAQLGVPGRSRPSWALARAVRSLPTLGLVALVALLADVGATVLLFAGGGAIARGAWPTPPPRDVARFAILILVVLALLFVGVLHDLARVAAVMGPSRTYVSLRTSMRVLWRSPGRVLGAYAWRSALGAAALVAAIYAGSRLGARTSGAVLASAFVHQLGLVAAGWMRLSWLSSAARRVRPVLAEIGRSETTAPSHEQAASSEEASISPEPEGASASAASDPTSPPADTPMVTGEPAVEAENSPPEPAETNRGNDPLA